MNPFSSLPIRGDGELCHAWFPRIFPSLQGLPELQHGCAGDGIVSDSGGAVGAASARAVFLLPIGHGTVGACEGSGVRRTSGRKGGYVSERRACVFF